MSQRSYLETILDKNSELDIERDFTEFCKAEKIMLVAMHAMLINCDYDDVCISSLKTRLDKALLCAAVFTENFNKVTKKNKK